MRKLFSFKMLAVWGFAAWIAGRFVEGALGGAMGVGGLVSILIGVVGMGFSRRRKKREIEERDASVPTPSDEKRQARPSFFQKDVQTLKGFRDEFSRQHPLTSKFIASMLVIIKWLVIVALVSILVLFVFAYIFIAIPDNALRACGLKPQSLYTYSSPEPDCAKRGSFYFDPRIGEVREIGGMGVEGQQRCEAEKAEKKAAYEAELAAWRLCREEVLDRYWWK